ncbi:hypothetical protein [Jonesia quinghaiensis]|uniref:hypothetical protein n=1 Tax=Jonesia quinghaiensis TaxID=262806 RepID=UPI0003F58D3A|nr:hypothetical protein [Jonesia quinghaiensis]
MKLSTRAVLTAAAAAGLAAGAFLGELPFIAALALIAFLFAYGWRPLLRLPSGGSTLIVVLSSLGGLAVVWATEDEPWLRFLPLVLAMGVLLAFIAEMLRPYPRLRLVDSLIGTVTGIVVGVSSAAWLATYRLEGGVELVVACTVGLAVASAVAATPLAGSLALLASVGAATVSAAAVAIVMPELTWVSGVSIGVLAGIIVGALQLLFDKLPQLKTRRSSFSVITLPLAVTGMMGYVVGQILI